MSYTKSQETCGKVTEYVSPKPYALTTKLSFFSRQQEFQVMPLLIKYADFLKRSDFQFTDRLVNILFLRTICRVFLEITSITNNIFFHCTHYIVFEYAFIIPNYTINESKIYFNNIEYICNL